MAEQEGVIKYTLSFQEADLPPDLEFTELNIWRSKMMDLGLIGQDPDRYDGYGFGNLSMRWASHPSQFVITGSQTGDIATLDADHYALVKEAVPHKNKISAEGRTKPSSESLTHAVLYQVDPSIGFVFHAHSPDIWRVARDLAIPLTSEDIAYGTPAMAAETERLFKQTDVKERGVFVMLGHEDGVVSIGATADEAGERLVRLLEQARTIG